MKVSDPLLLKNGIFSALIAWLGAFTVATSIFFRMGEVFAFSPLSVDLSVHWRTLASLPWSWLAKIWNYRILIENALSLTSILGIVLMGISSFRTKEIPPLRVENSTVSIIFGFFWGLYFTFAISKGISQYSSIHSNGILYFFFWGVMGGILFYFKNHHNRKKSILFKFAVGGALIGFAPVVVRSIFFLDDPFGDEAISSYAHFFLCAVIAFGAKVLLSQRALLVLILLALMTAINYSLFLLPEIGIKVRI